MRAAPTPAGSDPVTKRPGRRTVEGIPPFTFMAIMAAYAVGGLAVVPFLAAGGCALAGRARAARWLFYTGLLLVAGGVVLFVAGLLGMGLRVLWRGG